MISTVITENSWENITDNNWETFAKNENLFQSIRKTPESVILINKLTEKLNNLWDKVWFDFDDSFIIKLDSYEKLNNFNNWLDQNYDLLLNQVIKNNIRFIKISDSWSGTNTNYDDWLKIFELNLDLDELRELNEKDFIAEDYDFFISADDKEIYKNKLEISNNTLFSYINTTKEIAPYKDILLENLKDIDVNWFNKTYWELSTWFINLMLKFIQNWNIEKLKHKRLNIIMDWYFSSDFDADNSSKELNIELKVLKELWKNWILNINNLNNYENEYIDELIDEINWHFSSNQANIVQVKKYSWEWEFFEFRPTTDILKNNQFTRVSYNIFDNWNDLVNKIDIEINQKEKKIYAYIDWVKYDIADPNFSKNNKHIYIALTWMKWQNDLWEIKSIWWIIWMMLNAKVN